MFRLNISGGTFCWYSGKWSCGCNGCGLMAATVNGDRICDTYCKGGACYEESTVYLSGERYVVVSHRLWKRTESGRNQTRLSACKNIRNNRQEDWIWSIMMFCPRKYTR